MPAMYGAVPAHCMDPVPRSTSKGYLGYLRAPQSSERIRAKPKSQSFATGLPNTLSLGPERLLPSVKRTFCDFTSRCTTSHGSLHF